MKKLFLLLGAGLVPLLVGCASTSVPLVPVGPNPAGSKSAASSGTLQVFSRVVQRNDDRNQGGDGMPVWYQHSGYDIYNIQGKRLEHVANAAGHYAEAPEQVALPPGSYLVKAQAKDYSWVEVSVKIERGRTTRVHLDDNWKPPAYAPKTEVAIMPDGNPVGWSVGSAKVVGAN